MTLQKSFLGILALAGMGLTVLAAAPAQASPIIFNFTGTVTGTDTVNGISTPFTSQNVSFFAFGDTSSVTHVPGDNYDLVVSPVTFALTGVGSGVVTDPIEVFDNPTDPATGLEDLAGEDIFDISAPSFATYDLKSSLGPLPATPILFPLGTFNTTLGAIKFTSASNATFTAITAPVPEASTTVSFGLLLALGLGGVVIAAKRKKTA